MKTEQDLRKIATPRGIIPEVNVPDVNAIWLVSQLNGINKLEDGAIVFIDQREPELTDDVVQKALGSSFLNVIWLTPPTGQTLVEHLEAMTREQFDILTRDNQATVGIKSPAVWDFAGKGFSEWEQIFRSMRELTTWVFADIPLEQVTAIEEGSKNFTVEPSVQIIAGLGQPSMIFGRPAWVWADQMPTSVFFRDATGDLVAEWANLPIPTGEDEE